MADKLSGTGWFAAPKQIFESNLPTDAKLILLYLCRCAGADGKAFPSYRDIAKKCSITRRHAIDVIADLKRAGIVTAEPQRRKDGGKSSNKYTLDLSKLPGVVNDIHQGSEQHSPGGEQGSLASLSKETDIKRTNEVYNIASEFQGTPSPPDPAKRNGHKIAYDELPDDFPSLLKVARTLPEKYPPYKKSPRAKKLTYHPNWYTVCQKGLDILRGARDTGTGYSIASKYLKQAFESGYTPEQWLSCAKRLFELRAQGEEWAQYIQPATVNKMLPHFVANGLRGSGPRNVYRGESLAAKLREVG